MVTLTPTDLDRITRECEAYEKQHLNMHKSQLKRARETAMASFNAGERAMPPPFAPRFNNHRLDQQGQRSISSPSRLS